MKKRHPLYREQGMRRNADQPIIDPDEDRSAPRIYVSRVLFPGESFELSSRVKKPANSPVSSHVDLKRAEVTFEGEVLKEKVKPDRKFDKDTETLINIFGKNKRRR